LPVMPGASRFAYNQSLRLVTDALAKPQAGLPVTVPWSGFDLFKAFNAWKISEGAGRVFIVAPDGTTTKKVTGFPGGIRSPRRCSRKPPSTSDGRSRHTPKAGTGGWVFPDTGARDAVATASVCATRRTEMAVT
jgi:hypothetical protein